MKRTFIFCGFWVVCFLLLFLFYFVTDFYGIVGSGPGSWRKSTPLSFGERFGFSFIAASLITAAVAILIGCCWCIRQGMHWLQNAIRK
jgi:ABC-type Fe3+ transport system permease subunit